MTTSKVKYLILVFFVLAVQQSASGIQVTYHRTIETVMILRALSSEDYFLSGIPDTAKGRPLLFKARQHFSKYKDHPAVKETQRILYDQKDIGGQLFQGVIYADELPGATLKREPTDEYWRSHKDVLLNYMKLLNSFYIEANVDSFFRQNRGFYDGAIEEAKIYITDTAMPVMERYFGKNNNEYYVYLMPMCPYGWGFSLKIQEPGMQSLYAIVAPVNDIPWNDNEFTEFGYDGEDAKAHYNTIVLHEFTHAFITGTLLHETFKKQIAEYDYLYTPLLDSVMAQIGYSGWWSYVNEHLVRLGHVRVAAMLSPEDANDLRRQDMSDDKFVFMHELEVLIEEYEANRGLYTTIDDFLPVLISEFGKFSKDEMDKRITVEQKKSSHE